MDMKVLDYYKKTNEIQTADDKFKEENPEIFQYNDEKEYSENGSIGDLPSTYKQEPMSSLSLDKSKILDRSILKNSLTKDKKSITSEPNEELKDTYETDVDGNLNMYNLFNELHSFGDLPAVVYNDGSKEWYKNGILHRDGDKPAVISNGMKVWYKNGQIHRDGDKPAVIRNDGVKQVLIYYKNGQIHRDNFKPAIVDFNDKTIEFVVNGKYHNLRGPAIVDTTQADYDDYKFYIKGFEKDSGEFFEEGGTMDSTFRFKKFQQFFTFNRWWDGEDNPNIDIENYQV